MQEEGLLDEVSVPCLRSSNCGLSQLIPLGSGISHLSEAVRELQKTIDQASVGCHS